jgi:hypothetical protein
MRDKFKSRGIKQEKDTEIRRGEGKRRIRRIRKISWRRDESEEIRRGKRFRQITKKRKRREEKN